MITIQTKHRYSHVILNNESSHSYNDNKDNQLQHYNSESFFRHLHNQESNSDVSFIERVRINELLLSLKNILLVDDDPDITLTFKVGLEDDGSFHVYAYTDPLEALSNFKPHFYDLLLLGINMPYSKFFNHLHENQLPIAFDL